MPSYSVAEAKNSLPRLIDKALSGEEVIITRHGKVMVEVRARNEPGVKPPFDYEALRKRRDARPAVDITSVELLNLVYKDYLY